MDDQLKDRLAKYLDALERGAQKVGEFAEAEIPETIREWLRWLAIEHSVYAAVFVASAVLASWLFRAGGRYLREMEVRDPFDEGPRTFFVGLFWVLSRLAWLFLLGALFHGLIAVKCVVAPRVVVVEKAAELVRGK